MDDIRTAFPFGCNLVGFRKNDRNYGMICSWATQVSLSQVMLSIGHQSITGQQIAVGDKLGVSVLSRDQKKLCKQFGMYSSKDVEKYQEVNHILNDDNSILIPDSCKQLVVEVVDILELNPDKYAKLIQAKILRFREYTDRHPLLLDEFMRG